MSTTRTSSLLTKLLLLLSSLLIACARSQLQNADFAGKATVKLSSLYSANEEEAGSNDNSWPPSQDFAKIDVTVLGKTVSSELESKHMMPDLSHMARGKLWRILDDNLNPKWVSVDTPHHSGNTATRRATSPKAVDAKLAAMADQLNVSVLTDDLGRLHAISASTQHLFKTWLAARAACPMRYLWEDLGELFWPRWVRRGVCADKGSSCSWPPGMRCRESGRRTIKLLRWVCTKVNQLGDQDPRRHERSMNAARRKRRQQRRIQREKKRRRRRPRVRRRRRPISGVLPEKWRLLTSAKRERRRRAMTNRFSQTANGHFCYWKRIGYPVLDSCACECS